MKSRSAGSSRAMISSAYRTVSNRDHPHISWERTGKEVCSVNRARYGSEASSMMWVAVVVTPSAASSSRPSGPGSRSRTARPAAAS
ncbi:hypothetical protein ACWCQ0_50370, partial [Streptomyces massasporeus]